MEDEKTTSIVKVEEMSLDEEQLAEQLYNSAGLHPVVDAGLKDYDKRLQKESKLLNKVLGPRGTDIRGYGESVAKRVAFAVYALLNKQYGGKVGDLRSYIMSLEEDRDRANTRYDDLMGRVIGILGDEYKELRTDSKEFIEKLTTTLGDDLKEAKIDQGALAERLADIDGLRSKISTLNEENKQLKEKYEAQISELRNEYKEEARDFKSQVDTLNLEKEQQKERHEAQIAKLENDRKEEVRDFKSQIDALNLEKEQLKEAYESQIITLRNEHTAEVDNFKSQLAEMDSRIKGLESEKTALTGDLEQFTEDYNELKTAIKTLTEVAPNEEIGEKLSNDLYEFLLNDSKVPDMVINGVGKFINFKKYLGESVERGVKEVCTRVEHILGTAR
jgi:outer membrane murein-binding lipoprotein Lpp